MHSRGSGNNIRMWMVGCDLRVCPQHPTTAVTIKNKYIVSCPHKGTIPLDFKLLSELITVDLLDFIKILAVFSFADFILPPMFSQK